MSSITSESNALRLESPSQSVVREHESSNLLLPAFQKAIERAAEKQAAADRATPEEIGTIDADDVDATDVIDSNEVEVNDVNQAACHSVFERDAVTRPAGDLIMETSATSALAHLSDDVPHDYVPDSSGPAHLNGEVPQDNVPNQSAQANGNSPASQRQDTNNSRSIDTQGVVPADGENLLVATSELMAPLQPVTSSTSAPPDARGGIDQQAFDTLSHMLSRQNSLSDSQTQALTLKVIAGMPGVESLKVRQDQSGQWHLQLQLNHYSRRPEEQHKAQLLAELSARGHAMGSVSIFQSADSALAEQGI